MAKKYALIKGGSVERVIVADPEFFASADPAWLAQYTVIEEVTADKAPHVEPGAAYDADRKTFARAAPVEAPKSIEDRIAALEAAKAALAVK